MKIKRLFCISILLSILSGCLFQSSKPKGKTIVVTSVEDSGPGTLRQALEYAMPGDLITFDPKVFPPENPATIFLENENKYSALAIKREGITIDASNSGVILDGSRTIGDEINCLHIDKSNRNIIQGLQIKNFSGSGICIRNASYNLIGGDRNVGIGPNGQGNIINKNAVGIQLQANSSYNKITGNLLGTDPTITQEWGNMINGILKWGNMVNGILIMHGPTNNVLGPNNIIAHSGSNGVLIWGGNSFRNTITQNRIFNNAFGIRLAGGNTLLAPPLISEFNLASGNVSGSACSDCIIEIFSTSGNQGDIYEGYTQADSAGSFSFDHGGTLTGPFITATSTDADGNTSELGQIIANTQEGNNNPIIEFQSKQSNELEDNKIGIHFGGLWVLEPEVFRDGELNADYILSQGVKRARFSIDDGDWNKVQWDKPENTIDPSHDEFITTLADNDITITYRLSFWDKEYVAQGGNLPSPRFKTEREIQSYLDYVRFIVGHFKDRVDYYEIWNEPNILDSIQSIEVEDYINLVKRTVPIIRQEYPEAKIVVGGVGDIFGQGGEHYYLLDILNSYEIMPLVDVVSWHGMYSTSPEYDFLRQYYYDYPSLVQKIKDTASAHGFEGDYFSDELVWWIPATPGHNDAYYSETKCAKYYARGIIMNLGLDVVVSHFYAVPNAHPLLIVDTLSNLSTLMAGLESTKDYSMQIESEVELIQDYVFLQSNGDYLITLWSDVAAVDYDPGISSTLTLPNLAGWNATAIDVISGVEQELITSNEDGNLIINKFLIKDYPIAIRLSK